MEFLVARVMEWNATEQYIHVVQDMDAFSPDVLRLPGISAIHAETAEEAGRIYARNHGLLDDEIVTNL